MKRIEALRPITFQLVIEVEPYHWSMREPPLRVESPEEHAANWHSYFHACMADASISGVDPIETGSMFVDAFALVENELIMRMIREKLACGGLPGFPDSRGQEDWANIDDVASLDGGCVIKGADRVLLEPQCCTDFSTIESWQEALRDRPPEASIWIGHPFAKAFFQGDVVTIQEGWDSGEPPDHLVEFAVGVDELQAAVAQADKDRERLAGRVLQRVAELVGDPRLAEQACTCLMGRD